jgi:hypothetical protein
MICKGGKKYLRQHLAFGAAVLSAAAPAAAQGVTVAVAPDADSFVRSLAPANNYGAAGALSVSGATAVNGSGVQNGLFDALMRFPASNIVASLDGAFGSGEWVVTGVSLVVTEMAAPDNAIFNRGAGAFEVRWQAADVYREPTTNNCGFYRLRVSQ